MVDDITLWVESDCAFNAQHKLENVIENVNKATGEVIVRGTIRNLRVTLKHNGILIKGSLTKYYHGNNLENMTRKKVEESIKDLNCNLSVPIDDAIVYRVDLAYNFHLKNPLDGYLSKLGDLRYFKKSTIADGQTVMYENSRRALVFYDKKAEIKKKGGIIPVDLKEVYVLRYELRYKNRVKEQFGKVVKANDLYNEMFYKKAVSMWASIYHLIYKITDKKVIVITGNSRELKNHLMFNGLMALGGEENMYQIIKNNRKMGNIDKHESSRLKKTIKELANTPSLAFTNDGIGELDAKVKRVADLCE